MRNDEEMVSVGFALWSRTTLCSALSRKAALQVTLAVAVASALPSCTTALDAYDKNCSAFAVDRSLPFDLRVGGGRIAVNGHDIIEIKTEPKWFCRDSRRSAEIYSIVGKKYRVDIAYKANASRKEIDELLNDRSSPPDMADSVFNFLYLRVGKSGLLTITSNQYF